MTLPDKTLCWVEGPPWDRHCDPVDDAATLEAEAGRVDLAVARDEMDEARHVLRAYGVDLEPHRPLSQMVRDLAAALGSTEPRDPGD